MEALALPASQWRCACPTRTSQHPLIISIPLLQHERHVPAKRWSWLAAIGPRSACFPTTDMTDLIGSGTSQCTTTAVASRELTASSLVPELLQPRRHLHVSPVFLFPPFHKSCMRTRGTVLCPMLQRGKPLPLSRRAIVARSPCCSSRMLVYQFSFQPLFVHEARRWLMKPDIVGRPT